MTKDDKSPLSADEMDRALKEVVTDSGDEGIEHDELVKALDALEVLAIDAGLWRGWETGRMQIGWSVDDQELTFRVGTATTEVEI